MQCDWFSDVAFIICDHADELDWERLLEAVRIEEPQVPVYYTLRYLSRLLDIGAPEKVRVALRPDRFRRWWHECYVPEVRVPALDRNWPRPQFFFCPLS